MGYSARYHVASLVAVFIALAIGILIGAALGSDVVSGTADTLEKDLAEDLEQLRAERLALEEELDFERGFSAQIAPAVVANRLVGEEIALIGLGNVDTGALTDDVEAALEPTLGTLTEVARVREPPDADALIEALLSEGQVSESDDPLELAANRAGRRLAGRGPLGEIRSTLLVSSSGDPEGIDGAVIARARPEELSGREEREVDALEEGLIRGLQEVGVEVVGVEREDTEPSSMEFFQGQGLPTVDNVDTLPGRVALALALDGAAGNFGVKETADSLLPQLIGAPDNAASNGAGG